MQDLFGNILSFNNKEELLNFLMSNVFICLVQKIKEDFEISTDNSFETKKILNEIVKQEISSYFKSDMKIIKEIGKNPEYYKIINNICFIKEGYILEFIEKISEKIFTKLIKKLYRKKIINLYFHKDKNKICWMLKN
ncbi:MAG: hypothetical protein NZZ41_04815 [Candidatus Dojkabacteria bacterium]|nr:hypothetical protein [Candidatus Dojkabacteria bacterium]